MSRFGQIIFKGKPHFLSPVKCRIFINYTSIKNISNFRNFTTTNFLCFKYQTMKQMKSKLIKLLQADSQYSIEHKSKEHLLKYLPSTQEEIPIKKMKDSFDSVLVPLSSDLELRDKYTTFLGNVRLGRLMEDMDFFAVWCCTNHLKNSNSKSNDPFPYVIVTIRVDHIEFMQDTIQSNADIRLSGHVCWVGKSSLEVVVWLDQYVKGNWKQITRALFLMAARNSTNSGPGIVNKLAAETLTEEILLNGGEQRRIKRQKMSKESLLKTVPTEEELHLVHNLFMQTLDSKDLFLDKRILPQNSKWMQQATLNNLVFCHPENRNLHNKIFGGFLIRQALELSWSVAFLHRMRLPKLIHISDIGFYSPVDVGSLLKLFASVTFTEEEHIQVFVYAEAFSYDNVQGKSTTGFNFTYKLEKPVDKIYPSTYLEAMKFIDGRRHFFDVMNYSANTEKKNI